MPYCSAGWPVLGERKISLSSLREISTGKVALSVKPAASEMSLGRVSAVCMSHEIGGTRGATAHIGQDVWFHVKRLEMLIKARKLTTNVTSNKARLKLIYLVPAFKYAARRKRRRG